MRETALKTEIVRAVRAAYPSALVWRAGAGPYAGRSGVADVIACIEGRFVAIEAKAPGRYKSARVGLTANQRAFEVDVIQAGGIFIAADSVEEVLDRLDGHFAKVPPAA